MLIGTVGHDCHRVRLYYSIGLVDDVRERVQGDFLNLDETFIDARILECHSEGAALLAKWEIGSIIAVLLAQLHVVGLLQLFAIENGQAVSDLADREQFGAGVEVDDAIC